MTEKTPWEILSAIDVSDRIEKKNGMSYLSWSWAWAELRRHFPHAWFRKHENAVGFPCFHDPQGFAFVKVTVGLDRTGDHEVTETFPVLNHRNQPIQGPNSFEVNNALQRCLTKAIAYHGLGHYIYAGEDMPQEAQAAVSGGPSAPVGGMGTQTHATQPQVASQQAQGQGDPVVVSPDGENRSGSGTAKVIEDAFMAFMPHCKNITELSKFYSENRAAREYLADKDKAAHDRVVAAFSEKKRAFSGEQQPKQGE